MAAAAFEMSVAISLPAGWGEARLFPRHAHCPPSGATARSYDHAGHQLVWQSPQSAYGQRVACDVESDGRDCSFLAAHFGVAEDDFCVAWVATEVLAKLAGLPILQWLATHGLVRPPADGFAEIKLPVAGDVRARLLVVKAGGRALSFGRILCAPSQP